MGWYHKIKDLLIKIVLYQFRNYPAEKLNKELTVFLDEIKGVLDKSLRKNGGISYWDYKKGYGAKEADKLIKSDMENFKRLGRGGEIIANLIQLTKDLDNLEQKTLREKILIFDKLVHAEHWAGAYSEGYKKEERSIFGVDIQKIKERADKKIEKMIKEGKIKMVEY
jgi:hypothetical protein